MADQNWIRSLPPFGHVGSLTYIPYQGGDHGIGTFETSRKLAGTPNFRVISPHEVISPAPKLSDVQAVAVDREDKRAQERWLRNAHPEAFMGIPELSDILTEETEHPSHKVESHARPQVAAGEIADSSDPWRGTGVPTLAMTTGEGGQMLRILRLRESFWTWGSHEDYALNLWDLTPVDKEDEAYWCNDAAPIGQVEFVAHLAARVPLRWLIVQKETSTTVLSPTYHAVPVAYAQAALEERRVSRIDPNVSVRLTLEHTGGASHLGFAFNPPSGERPSQVSVIDSCGYWNIWDIKGSPKSGVDGLTPVPYKRGRIWEGPGHAVHPLVGVHWCRPLPANTYSDGSTSPQFLLAWNHAAIMLSDIDTGNICSTIPVTSASPRKEMVLGVYANPLGPSHFLVLTTHSLMCFGFEVSGNNAQNTEPRILQSLLHDHPGDATLRLTATHMPNYKDTNVVSIVIFPRSGPKVSLFWFHWPNGPASPPQFSHQLAFLRSDNGSDADGLRALSVLPLRRSKCMPNAPPGPGSLYEYHGVQFHQIVSVGRRQSMGYWVGATTTMGGPADIVAPTDKVPGRRADDGPAGKRAVYVNYMAEKFVVPEAMSDVERFVKPRVEEAGGVEVLEFAPLPAVNRQVVLKRKFRPQMLLDAFQAALDVRGNTLRVGSLEAVRQMLEAEPEVNPPARVSLLELTNNTQQIEGATPNGVVDGYTHVHNDAEWTAELHKLLEAGFGTLSLRSVHPSPPWQSHDNLDERLLAVKDWLARFWPIPSEEEFSEAAAQRQQALEDTARMAMLAYHTLGFKETFLERTQDTTTQASISLHPQATQYTAPHLSGPASSQSLPGPSQPTASQQETRRLEDLAQSRAAIHRLSNLAANPLPETTSKLASATQHSVLARWDEADRPDYVPFVARPAAEKEMALREKRERAAEKRRLKAETYNRLVGKGEGAGGIRSSPPPPTVRATEGGVVGARGVGDRGYSQAAIPFRTREGDVGSSQVSQNITMSQPVGGVFGQRKPAKKKKKGGIR